MIGDRKILAVITARAGSVGVVGKNYKPLLGKPLVIWSVEAALRSKYVDSIFVSTNCPHVKRAVSEWIETRKEDGSHVQKVIVIDRPEELSGPKSKNEEALLHSVQMYEDKFNNSPDIIVNLQPTSPVRNDRLLDLCIESMHDLDTDSLLTVNRHTPFFWRIIDDEPTPTYDPKKRPMRQNIHPHEWMYHDNGNVYIMTLQTLTDSLCRIGTNPFLFETSPYQSLQIDTVFDFQLIEKMSEIYGSLI